MKILANLFHLNTKQLTAKEKLTPIVILIVIGISSVMLLRPSLIKLSVFGLELTKKQDQLDILVKKKQKLNQIKQGVDKLNFEQQFRYAEIFLPSQSPSLSVLVQLERLARSNQVQFSGLTLNPGDVSNKDKQPSLPDTSQASNTNQLLWSFEINFLINGTYENCMQYLRELNNTAPLMKVNSLNLYLIEGNDVTYNTNDEVQLNLKVTAYYQELINTFPSIDTPLEEITSVEKDILDELIIKGQTFVTVDIASPETSEWVGNPNPFRHPQ